MLRVMIMVALIVAVSIGPANAWTRIDSAGKWQIYTEINPLDDTRTVILELYADTGRSRDGHPIAFVAQCKSNVTEAYVAWDYYLGDYEDDYGEWKRVTIRVGKGKARTERWDLSTDKEGTFVPGAENFLKDILDEERLVFQVIPHNENPVTAIFDIRGLRDVLGHVSEECGWSFK